MVVETIEVSSRFQSLSSFTTIYGIGAATARKLYDSFGLRTIADLEEHYAIHASPLTRNNGESKLSTHAPALSINAALALRDDLDEKIPRAEVELMHDIIMAELEKLRPGCLSTIVGGWVAVSFETVTVEFISKRIDIGEGKPRATMLTSLLRILRS